MFVSCSGSQEAQPGAVGPLQGGADKKDAQAESADTEGRLVN